MKHAYIHIPFCSKICTYCDFPKVLYDKLFIDKYLKRLEEEITSIYKEEELDTIYIGGGTPSALSFDELECLFKILEKLKKSKTCEYTIEGNFESTTKEKLELYKKYGINRISLGIESINEKNLKFLGRTLKKEDVEEKINLMRQLGFKNINLDLMYALPTEDINDLIEDLNFIISLDVEHISTYSLIIEDNTLLKIKNIKTIDEEKDEKMYHKIINVLKENNYLHYEISNFAKKGYESIHNLCYWQNKNYYGFGLGAASYIDNERITNTKSLTNYLNGINNKEIETLSKEDIIEYEVILGLRLLKGISLENFYQKYKVNLNEIYDYKNLVNNKFLLIDNNYLKIPEDKIYISNEIIVKLLQNYL